MKVNKLLKNSLFLLTILFFISVVGVGNGLCWFSKPWRDVTILPDDVYEKLATAKKISFKGKIKRHTINTRSTVWIYDRCVGGVLESGLFDSRYKLVSGETDFFSIAYGDLETEGEITATTFTYYSSDDTILGYAQETVLEEGLFRDYVFFFYDENKTRKPYYLYGNTIFDLDGNIMAEAKDDFKLGSWSGKYEIVLTFHDLRIDLEDKIFLYRAAIKAIDDRIPM